MTDTGPADYVVRETPRTPPPPDVVRRDPGAELARVDERFERHVRASAELIARDLAALLDRAHALGVAVIPDHDEEEGISYEIEWCYRTVRSLSVEWDARNQCHRVLTGTSVIGKRGAVARGPAERTPHSEESTHADQ